MAVLRFEGCHTSAGAPVRKLTPVAGVLALAASGMLYGQAVTGTLVGTVTDSTGASVPNARVTITEASTGVSRSTITNESGNYSFPDLAPGTCTANVEQTGFKKVPRANVAVLVNSTARVDLVLTPGQIIETVDVTAEAPMLQTGRAFRPHSGFVNPQNSLSTQVNGQSRIANHTMLEGIDDNERTGASRSTFRRSRRCRRSTSRPGTSTRNWDARPAR